LKRATKIKKGVLDGAEIDTLIRNQIVKFILKGSLMDILSKMYSLKHSTECMLLEIFINNSILIKKYQEFFARMVMEPYQGLKPIHKNDVLHLLEWEQWFLLMIC
ncbi:MAG: hypothetical protein ACI9QN_002000, partial [Arcticibacterium sp.]